MFFKKLYKLASIFTALGLVSAHASNTDLDLQKLGYYGFTAMPATLISQKDTLLLSDSPEYVGPVGGVLSAGTMNGKGRVYFYHVNEMADPHKIAIVLENTSDEPNTITVYRELKSVSTSDYFVAGRDLSRKDLEQPLTDKPLYSFTMEPHSRHIVFDDLEETPVLKDELFTGIVDLNTTAPVFTRVMMIPMGLNSVEASHWVKNLPIDHVRLRGTFTGAERVMAVPQEYNSMLGGAYVEIGNDREDPFVEGVDELDQNAYVKDVGNYGISYTLTIPTAGEDPFRLYLNPMGGAYSGSFTVKSQRRWQQDPGESVTYHVGGEDGIRVLGHNTIMDNRHIGSYNGGDTLTINFMPAGASNLPIRFLLIPEALANPQYAEKLKMTEAGRKVLAKEAKKELEKKAKAVAATEKIALSREKTRDKASAALEEAKVALEKANADYRAAAAKANGKGSDEVSSAARKVEKARLLVEKRTREYDGAQQQVMEARHAWDREVVAYKELEKQL